MVSISIDGTAYRFTLSCTLFEDTVSLLITANGKIGQLISVALPEGPDLGNDLSADFGMLPNTEITPEWLLGANDTARSEMVGAMTAQTASILQKRVQVRERRLLMGIMLPGSEGFWRNDQDSAEETRKELFFRLIGSATDLYSLTSASRT